MILAAIVLGLPGCAPDRPGDTLAHIRSTGRLAYGSDAEGGGPYAYPDPEAPGSVTGFEVELMDRLARELGPRPVLVQGQWDALLPTLGSGRIDLVVNGYELTPQRARDYLVEYQAGRMSLTARRLMDALVREHPQYTRELRANTFLLEPSRTREFERAMAELQQGLWLVKSEERYEPTFSYRWELVEAWLPEAVAEGRRLRRAAALDRLIARYVAGAVFASPRRLARLLGVPLTEVEASVSRLARGGALREAPVEGWPGRWVLAVR